MQCRDDILINVDTGCDEIPANRACKGVCKKKDIDPLPPVVMIQVGAFDYNNCK